MNQYAKEENGPIPGPSQPSRKHDSEGSGEPEGKVFKRKRLAKACDPCHKSKRRCDGTAPCSNCHFASKVCTYTDASGRIVPPPRSSSVAESPASSWRHEQPVALSNSRIPALSPLDPNDGVSSRRKKFKVDREHAIIPLGGLPKVSSSLSLGLNFDSFGSDPALTRELVNLFFTHRHPQRMMFHKPSFSAALSHNRVPTYLIRAICALAAPLSKQAHFRDETGSSRSAGNAYADEAVSLMFNNDRQLICPRNLETVQALCLLQMHRSYANPSWTSQWHAIALQVLDELGLNQPDSPQPNHISPSGYIQESIDRECMRRAFWLIHLLDLISSIYFKVIATPKGEHLPLPVDETSFELATHATLPPEYLYGPPLRDHRGSELGNVLRILTLYDKVENLLEGAEGRPMGDRAWIAESERELKSWEEGLPDNLRYSEGTVQIQLSMMETSSNTGAWSFLLMHVVHASCAAALAHARQFDYKETGPYILPKWAQARMEMIATSLGSRAKYSMILGCVLWPLLKYYEMKEDYIVTWKQDYHKQWGIWVEDTIQMVVRRPQPVAPLSPNQPFHLPLRPSYEIPREPGPSYYPQENHQQSYARSEIDVVSYGGGLPRTRDQSSGEASLPSLKSSGLLDSWPPEDPSSSGQAQWSQGRVQQPHRPQYPISAETFRGGPSGPPAGMPWLAKEPMSR